MVPSYCIASEYDKQNEKGWGQMAGIIERDKLVRLIFSSVSEEEVSARDKLNALIRAGQIASAC